MKCGQNESSIIESPREWNKGKECDWMRLAFSNDKERWEPATDRHKLTKGKSYVSTDTVIHDCPRSLLSAEKSARVLFCVCVCVVCVCKRERECDRKREKERECVWMLLLSFALGKVRHGSWFKNSISEDAELFILFTHPACKLRCIPAGECVCVCVCVFACMRAYFNSFIALLYCFELSHSFSFSLSIIPITLYIKQSHTDRQTHACTHFDGNCHEWMSDI